MTTPRHRELMAALGLDVDHVVSLTCNTLLPTIEAARQDLVRKRINQTPKIPFLRHRGFIDSWKHRTTADRLRISVMRGDKFPI